MSSAADHGARRVPGSKGGWVMVRDAVKRPHKDVPMPGSVKKAEKVAAAEGGQ
jgi:large subunit ribosomal protein L3